MKRHAHFFGIILWFLISGSLLPAIAQQADQIAFVSHRSGNDDIYLIDETGGQVNDLTNNPARDWHPDWSPDGHWLTFASNRDGNDEIYALSLINYRVTDLTNNSASDVAPDWSPDGKSIVFVSDRDQGYDLYLLDVASGSVLRLTDDTLEKSAPDWSPDGTTITYWARQPEAAAELSSVTVSTGAVERLGSMTMVNWPAWKPDGSVLAFEDASSGKTDIDLFNPASGTVTNLTNSDSNELRPAWKPDGSKLAFNSDRDGDMELYVMNADGSDVRRLTQSPGDDSSPAWQPISQTVIVTQVRPASADNPTAQVMSAIQLPAGSDLSGTQDAGAGHMTLDFAPRQPTLDEVIRIRIEVLSDKVGAPATPEATVEGTAQASATEPPIASQVTEVYTIMGAELKGVDLNRFEIDPMPTDYVLRLDLDKVNYWEWTLRPIDNHALGTNYLSADVYIPRVQPDGTVGKEIVNRVNFQAEIFPAAGSVLQTPLTCTPVQPSTMAQSAVLSAAPAPLFKVIYSDQKSFIVLTTNDDNLAGTSVTGAGFQEDEFDLGQDFPVLPDITWQPGICFSYILDGAAPILPRSCINDYEHPLNLSDVFWYDTEQNRLRDIIVRYANTTFTCGSGSVSCNVGQ